MSRKLIVPGYTFTGPKLKNDPIETDGSLLLVEPAHLAYPWAVGVPVSGTALTNVVAGIAAPYVGSASPAYTLDGLTGTYGLVERSGKGGIHGVASQAGLLYGKQAYITIPDGVIQYMIANPTHQFFYSAWERQTRGYVSGKPQPTRLVIAASDQVKSQTSWFGSAARPTSTNRAAANYTLWPLAAPAHQAITAKGWDGGVPSAPSEVFHQWRWGSTPANTFFNESSSCPSVILYRLYIEDLTISGRSHAAVYAIQQAMFDEAFGAGGRYDGDTYTDPATIP